MASASAAWTRATNIYTAEIMFVVGFVTTMDTYHVIVFHEERQRSIKGKY
jgi:hypothetical protein